MVVRAACLDLSGPGRREANAGPPLASPFLSSIGPPAPSPTQWIMVLTSEWVFLPG